MKKDNGKTLIATLTAVILLIPIVTLAANPPAPVEKTGQTISYRTGDDGYHQKGVASPNPRFTDNGDGKITDVKTGLMWAKDANLASGKMTWNDAIDYANNSTLGTSCGSPITDWRLPNRFEMESLLDLGNNWPALPANHPFTNVQSSDYWSSTTYTINTDSAFIVSTQGGYVAGMNKTYDYYVWPVRGPVEISDPELQDSIVFTGSSIISLWDTLADDMAPLPVLNQSIYGARMSTIFVAMDKLIVPLNPKIIVYYCGSNDINVGAEAFDILSSFETFISAVKNKLPSTMVYFVSINKAPQKIDKWDIIDDANQMIKNYCNNIDELYFIDINPPFLIDGQPRTDLYLSDGLHLKPEGYQELNNIIKPIIEEG
jgi:hypothetical protein